MAKLTELLAQEPLNTIEISKYFSNLLAEAVAEVNAEFGPRRLAKAPRQIEPLPTDTRQLSSYRTRIGTMLEYAISTAMSRLLRERYGDKYLLTFVSAHQYPDFFLRDSTLTLLLKIEMKAVDADSDEQAARFDAPTLWIDNQRDILLLIGWQWRDLVLQSGEVIGEYPHIFAALAVPAGEIAKERDIRLEITGGKIEGEEVYVYSRRKGEFVPDPGNYGKFWRIVHTTRRDSEDLSESMREFMLFLEEVDARSPRNRLGSHGQGVE
jgi:hypothetical protein